MLLSGTLAVLLVLLIGGYRRGRRVQTAPSLESGRIMLAVLPFENLTGDSGEDYLSDGLTEEMIAQLGWLDPRASSVDPQPMRAPPPNPARPSHDSGKVCGDARYFSGFS
jgi:hypothetical protein